MKALSCRGQHPGRGMEIGRRSSLRGDVLPDEFHLLFGERSSGRDGRGGQPVVQAMQAEVHLLIRHGEIEFFLRLGQTLTLTFAVTVTDAAGATVSQPVTITITGREERIKFISCPRKCITDKVV